MAKPAKQARMSKPANGRILSRANNAFATDIYQAMLPNVSSENLIFSPFSLHSVLGMVSQGARGQTKAELIRGLKFQQEDNDETIKANYGFVFNNLFQAGGKGVQNEIKSTRVLRSALKVTSTFPAPSPPKERATLRTANRVYCKTGFELNQVFVKDLQQNFLSDFEQLDLSTRPKRHEAADQINCWVENKTNGKIRNSVDPKVLEPNRTTGKGTNLVLINCIYFHGTWKNQFPSYATYKANFHVTPKKKLKVDMMFQHETLPYGELPELDAHVVEMQYKNPGDGRLSMRIILPRAVDGLAKIQNGLGLLRQNGTNLVKEAIDKFEDANSYYRVSLYVPKFEIEATIGNLKETLENSLGMKTIFSEDDADFGGIPDKYNPINPDHHLFVTQVLQKAFISVNEKETVAAARTMLPTLPARG